MKVEPITTTRETCPKWREDSRCCDQRILIFSRLAARPSHLNSHMWSFATGSRSACNSKLSRQLLTHADVCSCACISMSVFSATKQGSVDISSCTLLVLSFSPPRAYSSCAAPDRQSASVPFILCPALLPKPRSPKAVRGCRVTMRLSASDQDVVDGDVDCEREKIC